MKKILLALLLVCLFVPSGVWSANTAVSGFTADTSPTSDDLVPTVNAPGSSPANRKVTISNLPKGMTGVTLSDWPAGLDMTELGYVNGVTSAIQTQMDLKRTITYFNECKTITNPSDSDLLFFWIARVAFTASKITGIAVGGTSVVVDIHECDSDGTSNCTDISTNPVTVDLDGANTTTFDNGGIDAGDVLLIDIGTVTGAVTQVMVCVEGN